MTNSDERCWFCQQKGSPDPMPYIAQIIAISLCTQSRSTGGPTCLLPPVQFWRRKQINGLTPLSCLCERHKVPDSQYHEVTEWWQEISQDEYLVLEVMSS